MIYHIIINIKQQMTNNNTSDNKLYTHTNYHEIEKGTILYHASRVINKFNTKEINIGQEKNANLISFFTPNKEVAELEISKCKSIESGFNGWIHKFRVKECINNIFIVDEHDKDLKWDKIYLTNSYCATKDNTRLNGFGVFKKTNNNNMIEYYGLCVPKEYLEYMGTYGCDLGSNLDTLYDYENNQIIKEAENFFTNVPNNETNEIDEQNENN